MYRIILQGIVISGLLTAPALAGIIVEMTPPVVWVSPEVSWVQAEIWASIPEDEAIVAFGFDAELTLGVALEDISYFTLNTDLFMAMPGTDGDGFSGLSLAAVSGYVELGVLNIYVNYDPNPNPLPSYLTFTDDYPDDLMEGFALETPGEYADVIYKGGMFARVPEPTTLTLLGTACLAFVRRRSRA